MQANNGITGTIAAAGVSVSVGIFRYENIVVAGVVIMASVLLSVQDYAVPLYRKHGPEDQPEHSGKQQWPRHSSPSPAVKWISM